MIDRYTKAVLTVIAGCLLWLCAMSIGSVASAHNAALGQIQKASVQPVVIVGTGTLNSEGAVTIRFERPAGGGSPRTDPTLPVTLPYTAANPLPSQLAYTAAAPLPIEIAAVRKTGTWEPLRASVEDAPARSRPGGGR